LSGATVFTGGEVGEGYANLLAPQQEPEATLGITIAPTVYAEPMSPWPMPVLVRGGGKLPAGATLHVRGLPVSATLSEGHRAAPDAWIVPLSGVSRLEIFIGQPIPRRSDLLLMLATAEGKVLVEARAVLAVADTLPTAAAGERPPSEAPGQPPRPLAAAARPQAIATWAPVGADTHAFAAAAPKAREDVGPVRPGSPTVERQPPAPKTVLKAVVASSTTTTPELSAVEAAARTKGIRATPQAQSTAATSTIAAGSRGAGSEPPGVTGNGRRLAEMMGARGERELLQGNVSAARQFLLRAAEAGLARAALLLGSTYDEHEFARLRIRGLQPNPTLARKWYLRAQELGEAEAGAALLRLGVAD
jgi:hypothetical protein